MPGYDDFSPDSTYRRFVDLTVVHRDGSVSPVPAGIVKLKNGANVVFDLTDDSDEVDISVLAGGGVENPYYRQKYDTLAGGLAVPVSGPYPDPDTGITPTPPIGKALTWTFSENALWFGSINNVLAEPNTGVFFLVNDRCSDLGEFEAFLGVPEPIPGTLGLLDICVPCVDCLTWMRLEEYLDRLQTFYDYINQLIDDPTPAVPPEHPDGGVREQFSGLFQQTMAALRYWDYLVHRSTVKLSAQSQGQSIVAAGFYRNISDATIGGVLPGITFTYWFTFYSKPTGGAYCPWEGVHDDLVDVKGLERQGQHTCKVTDIQYLKGSLPPGCVSTLAYYHTVKVTMVSNWAGDPYTHVGLLPGEDVYADVALMISELEVFQRSGYEFLVAVTLEVSPVHMDPGSLSRQTVVYFVPGDIAQSSSAP